MSKNLNLVLYKAIDGKLVEHNVKTILSQEISDTLLKLITDDYSLISQDVYFDEELSKSFKIDCFDNSEVDSVLCKLKSHFKTLLSHEYETLIGNSSKEISPEGDYEKNIVDIFSHEGRTDTVEHSIARFSILTGVINLFSKKVEHLSSEKYAVIKLG
ncbi:TPA: hypothetical protein NKB38_004524 [Vibrio parahaemolyticus]|nr:hypothetical protein [Vibrio parahaemolyticus]